MWGQAQFQVSSCVLSGVHGRFAVHVLFGDDDLFSETDSTLSHSSQYHVEGSITHCMDSQLDTALLKRATKSLMFIEMDYSELSGS
jgi:hypothetical protein